MSFTDLLGELSVQSIVVAEVTTPYGPNLEDYFLVLVTSLSTLYEIPFESTEFEELMGLLFAEKATRPILGLANSTDFASNVLYPEVLRGERLFAGNQFYSTCGRSELLPVRSHVIDCELESRFHPLFSSH